MWDALAGALPVPGKRRGPRRDVSVWMRVALACQVLVIMAVVLYGMATDGPPQFVGVDLRGGLTLFGGMLGAEWARAWGARDW